VDIAADDAKLAATMGGAISAPRMPAVVKPTATAQITMIGCRLTLSPMMRGTRMLFSNCWIRK
jgi:hypothetical protein